MSVHHRISGIGFRYYTPEEIRRVSAVRITIPFSFDAFQNPLDGGLYDPLMGSLEMSGKCKRCGLSVSHCSGHLGHIELSVPVYHPLLFVQMMKLMNNSCLVCKKFRLSDVKKAKYLAMFKLLYAGKEDYLPDIEIAFSKDKALKLIGTLGTSSTTKKKTSKNMKNKKSTSKKEMNDDDSDIDVSDVSSDEEEDNDDDNNSDEENDSEEEVYQQVKSSLKSKEKKITAKEQKAIDAKEELSVRINRINQVLINAGIDPNIRSNPCIPTTHNLAARKELVKQLFSDCSRSCPHCNVFGNQLRKEGFTKIFKMPVGEKKQMLNDDFIKKYNQLNNITVSSSLYDNTPSLETTTTNNKHNTMNDSDVDASDVSSDEKEDNDDDNSVTKKIKNKQGARLVMPNEVERHLISLYQNEFDLLSYIWGSSPEMENNQTSDYRIYLLRILPVPASKFRPPNFVSGQMTENSQNVWYRKVIQNNALLYDIKKKMEKKQQMNAPDLLQEQQKYLHSWIELQDAVNCLMDNTKAANNKDSTMQAGIRQVLEKKEGLFRRNMMGKRVNFAARSVISPDPYIHSNEIGVPDIFASELTFETPVTSFNVHKMRQLVINGPKHPGANFVKFPNGRKIDLQYRSKEERIALSKLLLVNNNDDTESSTHHKNVTGNDLTIVYRHLETGDVMLVNRQPTLHKASMMAHKARVLYGPNKTIRMHYANCNSYNADFDGDEMNLHFPQNQMARSEAYSLANTDNQYITSTSGNPLRGLIQDHVVSGVLLTKIDSYFQKDEFMQLFYSCTHSFVDNNYMFECPIPCIIKPVPLYSGKQLISCILRLIAGTKNGTLTFSSATKTPKASWGQHKEEGNVIIRKSCLLQGVLDKAAFGATKFGLIHAVYELFGAKICGDLLTCFSRLFTIHLQSYGHTCGVEDLILNMNANENRKNRIHNVHQLGIDAAIEFAMPKSKDSLTVSTEQLNKALRKAMKKPNASAQLDTIIKNSLSSCTSSIIRDCLPSGQVKPFPSNCMDLMINTGAKGSQVNFSQISCLLGQQELEGRRVPMMNTSGKTLPSFSAFDPTPRAGGYITDRFLTGIKPQEYYFHCMAGREGLVDTAVKTSRSGYLQRCLVKHLESLVVSYDYTVRSAVGTSISSNESLNESSKHQDELISFYYGDDSCDVTKSTYLKNFDFFLYNMKALESKLKPIDAMEGLELEKVEEYNESNMSDSDEDNEETLLSKFNPGVNFGCVSNNFNDSLDAYLQQKHVKNELLRIHRISEPNDNDTTIEELCEQFAVLMRLNYRHCLVNPGESVGVLTAQSIGEPSTQMTLNTFHLAGHGGANVTLGIPRLREIVMVGSKTKTPIMEIPLSSKITREKADLMAYNMTEIKLIDYVIKMTINETINLSLSSKIHTLRLYFPSMNSPRIKKTGLTFSYFINAVTKKFAASLSTKIIKIKKARGHTISARAIKDDITEDYGKKIEVDDDDNDPNSRKKQKEEGDNDDNNDNESDSDSSDDSESKTKDNDNNDEKNSSASDSASDDEGEIIQVTKKSKKTKKEIESLESKYTYIAAHRVNEDEEWIELDICLDINDNYLIMNLAETCINDILLRSIPQITSAVVLEKNNNGKKELSIQLSGCNYPAIWKLKNKKNYLKMNNISSNDVGTILSTFGVEAARQSIINEISAVFNVYGIKIDRRHMYLLADYMTWEGKYRALSRTGIASNPSMMQKVTFETSMNFLLDSCNFGDMDVGFSPSTNIVLGQPATCGTGNIDLFNPV